MQWIIIIAAAVLAWLWYQSDVSTAAADEVSGAGTTSGGGPADSSDGDDPLQNFAQAIYQYEGDGQTGATNSWNNNPGNIGGGDAIFSDIGDGWQALYDYITGKAAANPDWTLTNFFSNYLTGDPNDSEATAQGDPNAYAQYVANYLGVSPNDTLGSVLGIS